MQTSGGGNYLFSLQPTFTQGLVLGQLSILFLLSLILKYLFLDAARPLPHLGAQKPLSLPVPVARTTGRAGTKGGEDGGGYEDGNGFAGVGASSGTGAPESAEWMNAVLQQVRPGCTPPACSRACSTRRGAGDWQEVHRHFLFACLFCCVCLFCAALLCFA